MQNSGVVSTAKSEVLSSDLLVGVDYWAGFASDCFVKRDLPFFQRAQIRLVRLEFGSWSAENLRSLVPALTSNGITIIGMLMRSDLIDDINGWAAWVSQTVRDYKDEVGIWEVWNEPNWGTGFQNSASRYVEFLKKAYVSAKQSDPDCKVLGGSLLGTTDATLLYLREMYMNGAKNFMDGLSVHPYCGRVSPLYPNVDIWGNGFWRLQDLRSEMIRFGDSDKGIWVTEIGWETVGSDCNTDVEQAAYLVQALELARSWEWFETLIVYNWMDAPTADLYYGLVRNVYFPQQLSNDFCKSSFFAIEETIGVWNGMQPVS
jgi:hypothetical protein